MATGLTCRRLIKQKQCSYLPNCMLSLVKQKSSLVQSFICTKTRKLGLITVTTGVGGGLYYMTLNDTEKRKGRVLFSGIGRFFRSLYIGLTITVDYWWSLKDLDQDSESYNKVLSKIHQRSAEMILNGCLKNGGLYVKLGQGLVSLNHILPREYLQTLKSLQDQCLTRKKDELKAIFMEEFGKLHTDLYSEFDEDPIAAASLAQVFRARTKNGDEVAVKVQYIDLKDRFIGDISTIYILLKIAALVHKDFDFQWVLDELKDTLEQELDFINEGKNAERCAMDLSRFNFVYVPKIYWDLCTSRIMTTEFIKGVKVNEVNRMKENGLSLADVDKKLFTAFSEQIFHSGFIHADPHPGNVLVRKSQKTKKAEIVLLDHGLYQVLPQNERIKLCNLWKSIVLHDRNGMSKYSQELGVEDPYLFAEILMQRPLKLHKYQLRVALNEEDMKYMTHMARQRFDKIILALRQMPKNMLLVIRNMNTIRAIAKDHGDPIDRYKLMARSATQGAFTTDNSSFYNRISAWKQRLKFEFFLLADSIKLSVFQIYYKIVLIFGLIPDYRDLAADSNLYG